MSNKEYFAYIRVSTVRQGQTGTSLAEQRSAIERYARKWDLKIVREFEEQETAAKRGRPVFRAMLNQLKRGRAAGVIMHKIDRSARNLRDWAELGELIDRGVEVHFANENLDLYSRGGRLSADIQAVVAADYVRNLREEVKKGIYGRINQGFYPMPAPLGYLDKGAGKPKAPDPVRSHLVKKAFELYATGYCGIRTLAEKMHALGLRGKRGQRVSANSLAVILHNPFYTGVIYLKATREYYPGRHQPIVSKELYDQVQAALSGKTIPASNKKNLKEEFLFRKLLACSRCKYRLIGERQKGYRYYRCHTKACPQKTIREELVTDAVFSVLEQMKFSKAEEAAFRKWHQSQLGRSEHEVDLTRQALKLQLEQTSARLSNLTDAFIDGLIEKELFLAKKTELVTTEKELRYKLDNVETLMTESIQQTVEFLERANSAYSSFKSTSLQNRRDLVRAVTSNFEVSGKSVVIKLNLPFEMVVNRERVLNGGAQRYGRRIFPGLLSQLLGYFCKNEESHGAENADGLDLGLAP